MKLFAVKENKEIKINSDLQEIKRLNISGANCFIVKKSINFCVIKVFGRGEFAIEKSLANLVEVEYV